VAHLSAKYDDAYRLKEVDRQYAPQGQALLDDVAISPLALEAAAGNRTFPTVAVAPNRLRQETFQYDSLSRGNHRLCGHIRYASPRGGEL